MVDEHLGMLTMALYARLGRLPTEDEVLDFIYGSESRREEIWNSTER